MKRLPWGAGATELREFSGKQWTRRGFSGGGGDLWVPGQAAAGKPFLLTNCFPGRTASTAFNSSTAASVFAT
jgi:hypothetical protein